MSVQLILYPQVYNSQYNAISSTANQFIVNGGSFNGFNLTTSTDIGSGPYILNAIIATPASIPNTWYRFRSTTGSGTPSLPVEASGAVTLNSGAFLSLSGMYQRLTNLDVGQEYEITVNLSTTGTGAVFIGAFEGSTQITSQAFLATSATITKNFVATNTTNTIAVSYYNVAADNIVVNSVSAIPRGLSASGNINDLEDGQVICDLYEEEDLPLTLSVDDFKNVAEKVQSYSKAFNLPGTKRNNKIFENLFEITRTAQGNVTFNPYLKTQSVLKQDGFVLFEGYLRVLDIQEKKGEISYNVNLYSEVVAVADVLKENTFSDLDFTELTHDYNKSNIKLTWTTSPTYTNPSTSGFRNADTLKYPFVDWMHNYTENSNGPVLPNLESTFRPFINIKYLIDRIFNQPGLPFTYTSDFFNTTDFKKLYMDFNWGSDNIPKQESLNYYACYYTYNQGSGSGTNTAGTSYTTLKLSYDIPDLGGLTPPNYNDTTNVITSTQVNETYDIYYNYKIENTDTVDRTVECRWLYNTDPINYSGVITLGAGEIFTYAGTFTQVMENVGDTLVAQFKASSAGVVRQAHTTSWETLTFVSFDLLISAITTNTILQTLRGELGQWEFLKGIMTMFNLVSTTDPSTPNNILIEPYNDVFLENSDSKELDWTDKIDISEIKLNPLTDLNKNTIFKFVEDDDDYAFNVYRNSTRHLYGSQKFDASGFTILEGEEEIVAEPFAATIPKSLMTQFADFIIPSIYSYNTEDGTSSGFDNSPRIMYNNGVKDLPGYTYFIPEQNGQSSENQPQFLQFSHLTDIPTLTSNPPAATDTRDFNFGICQLLTGVGNPTVNNLFNTYWLPYLDELYNPDTRTMTIKVNLTPGDINTFNFYDVVFIKNRKFRVNKIDYKPNDLATVEFILIP